MIEFLFGSYRECVFDRVEVVLRMRLVVGILVEDRRIGRNLDGVRFAVEGYEPEESGAVLFVRTVVVHDRARLVVGISFLPAGRAFRVAAEDQVHVRVLGHDVLLEECTEGGESAGDGPADAPAEGGAGEAPAEGDSAESEGGEAPAGEAPAGGESAGGEGESADSAGGEAPAP